MKAHMGDAIVSAAEWSGTALAGGTGDRGSPGGYTPEVPD